MPELINAITTYFTEEKLDLAAQPLESAVDALFASPRFRPLLESFIAAPVFSNEFNRAFANAGAVGAIAPARQLRGALNLPLRQFFSFMASLAEAVAMHGHVWRSFADHLCKAGAMGEMRVADFLTERHSNPTVRAEYQSLSMTLIDQRPHAIYPTSNYRECDGFTESANDQRHVEAVMSFRTAASLHMTDNILAIDQRELRNIYEPLGRCVCFIDEYVHKLHGDAVRAYFSAHGITLEPLVYRALEVDKGLSTVEQMLGDLKRLGIARNEPVLLIGGGVLADTGGLACALYGRNTPYVMLATSIVSGIDAGPSPRTCCDAFGYKNLLGAYHPPATFFVDRFFFRTLHEGWLRHGIAEIIKIALVRNLELVEDLEQAAGQLIETRFATIDCDPHAEIQILSQKILAGAMRSYIDSEYENLYETHQCRPHAYGHTWSPGFEIEAGLLHGHAVAIDMGFGAYCAMRQGLLDRAAFDRILALISAYKLSLWHDILDDDRIMWESHKKIIQKRGGNLVAPVPSGAIGQCGYINQLSQLDFFAARNEYRAICAAYAGGGRGVDPLCEDVGLMSAGAMATVK